MSILAGCPVYKDFTHKEILCRILYCLTVSTSTWISKGTNNMDNKKACQCHLSNLQKKFSVTQDNIIAAFKSFKHGMFTILCLNFQKMNPLLTASDYEVL